MKKNLTLAFCALSACAFAITASQEWVKDYISRLNGGTNSVLSVEGQNLTYTMTYQLNTEHALMVTNSVAGMIRNGTKFAYVGDGVYRNKVIGQTITATETNFVWNGIQSHVVSGFDAFDGNFSVCSGMITKEEAEVLK